MPNRTPELALLVAIILAGCGGPADQAVPFDQPVILEIERGTSSRRIAERLESLGVIDSKWHFLWVRAWNRDMPLLAGEYQFRVPVEAREAFETIANGQVRLYRLTIPEGLNRLEIAALADQSGLVDGEEFLWLSGDPSPVSDLLPQAETLEGCLFPETYSLAKTSTAKDLVAAMVARFRGALLEARSRRTSSIEDWDALVLASMIEKETGQESEHGLVSSVFHNRMRLGMRMQCDPTVIYGLMLEGSYRGRLLKADLARPHPYNTYVHGGLPPGPITNPGRPALLAAFAPDASSFLYFVAKPGDAGGHVFSKSLGAHNRAVRNLRQFQRTRRRSTGG